MAIYGATDIYNRFNGRWRVMFYSPSIRKYIFASSDTDGGDNIAELHDNATDARNYFIPAPVPGSQNTYTFFSQVCSKYLFGSSTTQGGDNMIELHGAVEPRNNFQIDVVNVNTVTLLNVSSGKKCFASSDTKGDDNVLEMRDTSDTRIQFQVIFEDSQNVTITNMSYNLNLARLVGMPPIVLKTLTVPNQSDQETSQDSTFAYSMADTQNWGNLTTLQAGAKVTGEMGVPFIADGRIQISAPTSNTFTVGQTITTDRNNVEKISIKIPPKSTVTVELVCQQGNMSVPYTATATNSFSDGTSVSVQFSDTFSGVALYNVSPVYHKPTPFPAK